MGRSLPRQEVGMNRSSGRAPHHQKNNDLQVKQVYQMGENEYVLLQVRKPENEQMQGGQVPPGAKQA